MKLLKQAEYMAATGFTAHQPNCFRSGLGPYKAQLSWAKTGGMRADLTIKFKRHTRTASI